MPHAEGTARKVEGSYATVVWHSFPLLFWLLPRHVALSGWSLWSLWLSPYRFSFLLGWEVSFASGSRRARK